jgi:hypothetical protein
MQSNLTIIELAEETKSIARALLEKLEDFPPEYTPAAFLCAISSSGYRQNLISFWHDLIEHPVDLPINKADQIIKGREKLRDANLAIETEIQAVLAK